MAQIDDKQLVEFIKKSTDIKVYDSGVAIFWGRLYIPKNKKLRKSILKEAYWSKFSIHQWMIKMYRDIKHTYWLIGIKRDVTDFVSKCLTCQQVKSEHQLLSGLLKPLPVPDWKWECFLRLRVRTSKWKNDFIWVVVGRLTKSTYFILVKATRIVK